MSDENLIHVQYLGNSENENNTGAITLGPSPDGEDREDIALLGKGYMTQEEVSTAQRFGLVLRQVAKTADTDVSELKADEIKEELELIGKSYDEKAKVEELRSDLEVARAELAAPGGDSPAVASDAGDSVSSATASGSTNAGTAGPSGTAGSSAGSTSTGSAS